MKRFRTKKKSNNIIIYLGLFLISVALSIKYIYEKNLINDDTIVSMLVSDSLNTYKKNINDVDFILKYALNINLKKEEKKEVINVNKEEKPVLIKNEVVDNEVPIVYIYNSHQEEKYKNTTLKSYNVSSTVLLASKILKEYLKEEGINAIVEEKSVSKKLNEMKWKYGYSYKVSRGFMEEARKNNPKLTYFIDVHRDSSKYEATTTEIDGEKYARLLFVIGLDNPNYENNLLFAKKLKEKIVIFDKDLFRGIMKKSGKGVNGVYNQDFSPHTILVEVGGQYNNIKEVNNSLRVFAKTLAEYIREEEVNGNEKE